MEAEPKITEMLESIEKGAEPTSELLEFFRRETEACCRQAVSDVLRRRVGASDVFAESVQATLDAVMKKKTSFANRRQALRYLARTIRNVAASHARFHSAGKRSQEQTERLPFDVEDNESLNPETRLAMTEVCAEIRTLIASEEDPMMRMALALRICIGPKARQVAQYLNGEFPDEKVPSADKIQRKANAKYAELEVYFQEKYGDT